MTCFPGKKKPRELRKIMLNCKIFIIQSLPVVPSSFQDFIACIHIYKHIYRM